MHVALSLFPTCTFIKLFNIDNEICILYLLQVLHPQSSDNALVQSAGVGLSHLTLSAAGEDDP